jgi:hypothetical protein
MNISCVSWVVVALAVGSMSCGSSGGSSSSGSPSCSPVSACGGDIKGDWKVEAACLDPAALEAQAHQVCDDATLSVVSPKVSGTISYKADNTYVQSASMAQGTVEFVLGASCLKQGALTLTCQQIQDQLNKDPSNPPSKCTNDNGGCKCSAEVAVSGGSNGTYSVVGNTVTLKDSKNMEVVQDYCIVGSKLYMLPTADSALPAQLQFLRQ